MSNGFVFVLVSTKHLKYLKKSIELIRRFDSKAEITVWHDKDICVDDVNLVKFERIEYEKSCKIKNSNLFRMKALMESPYENTCYLDNDIYIIHQGFWEGFKIAKLFGLAMPMNPRKFVTTWEGNGDSDVGGRVNNIDTVELLYQPQYMTAHNTGVIFYNQKAKVLLNAMRDEIERNVSRGQTRHVIAFCKSGLYPYILPENYCVCVEDVDIKLPLALHVGHPEIYALWEKLCRK